MGLFNILDPVLDAILGPIAGWNPSIGLIIITLVISLAIVLIYKFTTNQNHMRSLREQIKKYQDKIKTLKEEPQMMMKEQKKMMSINMELMKHSMRPTLFTFIPIIIIFGWLSAHLAFMPIVPGQEFNVTVFTKGDVGSAEILVPSGLELLSPSTLQVENNRVAWTLKGDEGVYELFFEVNGIQERKRVVISQEHSIYAKADKNKRSMFDFIYSSREGFIDKEGSVQRIHVDYNALKPLPFSLFGWKPGWLGTYILFSILFSVVLRKVLKIY